MEKSRRSFLSESCGLVFAASAFAAMCAGCDESGPSVSVPDSSKTKIEQDAMKEHMAGKKGVTKKKMF